jgi:hypothetical protein
MFLRALSRPTWISRDPTVVENATFLLLAHEEITQSFAIDLCGEPKNDVAAV